MGLSHCSHIWDSVWGRGLHYGQAAPRRGYKTSHCWKLQKVMNHSFISCTFWEEEQYYYECCREKACRIQHWFGYIYRIDRYMDLYMFRCINVLCKTNIHGQNKSMLVCSCTYHAFCCSCCCFALINAPLFFSSHQFFL